jgi:hypothetical protein
MYKKLILIFLVLSFCGVGLAESGLDFSVPAPGGSKFLENKDLVLANRQVNSALYSSNEEIGSLSNFYRDFFVNQGFRKIIDSLDQASNQQLLRFQKDTLVVSIAIFIKDNQANIVVSKYLQSAGEPAIEEAKPSVNDTLMQLPKKDVPGKDYLPRPPASVRVTFSDQGQTVMIIYTTELTVAQVIDFYRKQMLDDWDLVDDAATEDTIQAYTQVTGKKNLGVELPFSDGEDLEGVLNDSHMLSFTSGSEKAEIIVFPNFASRELGSMIKVSYRKAE